jgi:hypothetical protein
MKEITVTSWEAVNPTWAHHYHTTRTDPPLNSFPQVSTDAREEETNLQNIMYSNNESIIEVLNGGKCIGTKSSNTVQGLYEENRIASIAA